MEKNQVLIVGLLVVAILFSITSIVVSVSLTNFNPVGSTTGNVIVGNPNGNVNIVVNPTNSTNVTQGGTK